MPSLKVWNVGHGEAMRIDLDDRDISIIRDWGQHKSTVKKTRCLNIASIEDQLLKLGTGKTIDAVLSHAHYDHFNGFDLLYNPSKPQTNRKIFRAAYIPWLDHGSVGSLGLSISRISTYLYVYSGSVRQKADRYRNWFLAAPILYSLSRHFYGVAAGYTLNWGNSSVLWPPPPDKIESKALDFMANTLRDTFGAGDNENLVQEIEHVASQLNGIMALYHPQITPDSIGASGGSVQVPEYETHYSIIHALFKGLTPLSSDNKKTLPAKVPGLFRRASGCLEKSIDDHSVVFEVDNKALFLSDLHPSAMSRMAKEFMASKKNYTLVKSAHHGTRIGNRSFRSKLGLIDTVIHCCGSSNKTFHAPCCTYCQLPSKTPNKKVTVLWTADHENRSHCCKPNLFPSSYSTFVF